MSKFTPSIICLQETHFKQQKFYKLKNYTPYIKNRLNANQASGGTAIYVHNQYNTEIIDLNTQLEAIAISLKGPQKINICNIYIPPGTDPSARELSDLFNQIPQPRIILGDFNAHHVLWGSSKSDSLGRKIEQIITNLNVNLLNDGSITRFNVSTGGGSAIDLTLCDPVLQPGLSWQVTPYLHGSDHFPILITNNNVTPSSIPSNKWNLKHADWSLYSSLISRSVSELTPPSDDHASINHIVSSFIQLITTAAELSVGFIKFPKKHPPVPWWNQECKVAIRESKSSFYKFKKISYTSKPTRI